MVAGCESQTSEWREVARPAAARGFNVLVITLDTVRWDRLGCYGDVDAETGTIDGLLAHGVRFGDAVTCAPLTLPAHATLFTGLDPPRHGVRDNGNYSLAEDRETLAETLRTAGYETAAFVGSFVLDERFGLGQGFDHYDFEVSARGFRKRMPDFNERPADEVTDAAIAWLARERSAPFFAWVHYFDAHLPYSSPLAGSERFRDRPYDAEIAFIDSQIARLLEAISDERERTLIIVTADHGEALGEHEEPTHGMLIYDCTVRVPLILSAPGLFPRSFVEDDRVVGLVDLKATIEELVGLTPEPSEDGRSLLAARDPRRAIYLETHAPVRIGGWSALAGLRFHDAKFIAAPEREYYDLTRDPGENENLWTETHPSNELAARVDELRRAGGPGVERVMSPDEMARLEALGYVQPGGAKPVESQGDPKRGMALYNDALRAERLYANRQWAEAANLARSALERNPNLVQARRVLAFSEVRLGRTDVAVDLLRESTGLQRDPFLLRALAELLIVSGRLEEARAVLDTYEAVDPDDGRVPLLRGDCFAVERQRDAAIAAYREAERRDPNRIGPLIADRIRRVDERNRAP